MPHLFPDELPGANDVSLSITPSLVGLNPGLQSGHLLTSIKSRCVCCGQEIVDDMDVPDELLSHGVQVCLSVCLSSLDEYGKLQIICPVTSALQ